MIGPYVVLPSRCFCNYMYNYITSRNCVTVVSIQITRLWFVAPRSLIGRSDISEVPAASTTLIINYQSTRRHIAEYLAFI
jgi:hypothetical protein